MLTALVPAVIRGLLFGLGASPSIHIDLGEWLGTIVVVAGAVLGLVKFRQLNGKQGEELETRIRQRALEDVETAMKMLREEMGQYVRRIGALELDLAAATERISDLERQLHTAHEVNLRLEMQLEEAKETKRRMELELEKVKDNLAILQKRVGGRRSTDPMTKPQSG